MMCAKEEKKIVSLSLRFLSKVVSTSVFALVVFATQSSVYAITNCQTGYKPQTNPFSRWSGCGVADNGIGETSSTANGEWSASFSFGDFITVKGNAYCLNEQYSMPSQRTSCDEYAFPVVENVNTTQTGNVCWCQVTAWQPYTVKRDAPFQEIEAKYIQIPVEAIESCNLTSCGNICASVGNTSATLIGLYRNNAGLRAAMYNSVKECVTDANHNPTDCQYGYEYSSTTSQCEAITYTISYELNDGTNNNNNPSSYTIETPTITLQDPTKSGFDFVGWFDENGNKVTEITTNSYGDRTLYAEWTEIPIENLYTVNWAAGVHGMGNMLAWSNKHASDMITLPSNNFNAQNGYVFDGWNCDNNIGDKAVGAIFYMPEADVTCTAQWRVISVSECEAGYYSSSNGCVICEENHYCTGGQNSIMQSCSTGLVAPEGTVSADHCGKIMLVGEDVLYLTQTQQTTPALAVKVDGKTYYAKTTPISQIEQPAEHFLRTKIDGIEYSIHDNRF